MAYRIIDAKLNEIEAMQWTGSEDELDIAAFLGEGYDIDGCATTLRIIQDGRFAPDEYSMDKMCMAVPPYWWLIWHPLFGISKVDPETFNKYMETCNKQEDR